MPAATILSYMVLRWVAYRSLSIMYEVQGNLWTDVFPLPLALDHPFLVWIYCWGMKSLVAKYPPPYKYFSARERALTLPTCNPPVWLPAPIPTRTPKLIWQIAC